MKTIELNELHLFAKTVIEVIIQEDEIVNTEKEAVEYALTMFVNYRMANERLNLRCESLQEENIFYKLRYEDVSERLERLKEMYNNLI